MRFSWCLSIVFTLKYVFPSVIFLISTASIAMEMGCYQKELDPPALGAYTINLNHTSKKEVGVCIRTHICPAQSPDCAAARFYELCYRETLRSVILHREVVSQCKIRTTLSETHIDVSHSGCGDVLGHLDFSGRYRFVSSEICRP